MYGLGADALDADAVAKIFAAKGRPADNPLIVHVASVAEAKKLVATWPATADRLAAKFWPGPLTLVLPRSSAVPDAVTAGLDSIAVRVPAHPVARALLEKAGLPVAAPSANRSGRPSPTRVEDALADLGRAVAVYLDGGPTTVGVESTVVDLLGPRPRLLRPGGVPREALEAIAGPWETAPAKGPVRSPGLKHKHYAPRARIHLVPPERLEATRDELRRPGRRVAIVASREEAITGQDVLVPGSRDDAATWARVLFSLLRDLDAEGYDDVVVEEIPEAGLGAAVLDRLRRAAER